MTLPGDQLHPSPGDVGAFNRDSTRWDVFRRSSNQKRSEEWNISTQLTHEQFDIFQRIAFGEEANIVLLGVGNGEMELSLLEGLLRQREENTLSGIHVYCEDPSEEMRLQFFQALNQGGYPAVQKTSIHFDTHKLEDPAYQIPPADFVVASHMLYYSTGWEDSNNPNNPLRKILSSLEKRDGAAIIVMQGETSETWRLRQRFNELMKNGRVETSGADVLKALKQLDPDFIDEKRVYSELNVSLLLSDTASDSSMVTTFAPTDKGKKLLSFLFRTDWDSIPASVQEDMGKMVLLFVKENLDVRPVNIGLERTLFWLEHRDDYIWIRPNFHSAKQRRYKPLSDLKH